MGDLGDTILTAGVSHDIMHLWYAQHESSLRSPGRRCLFPFLKGHASLGPAVGVHHVDVVLSDSVGAERDIPPVR